MPRTDAPSGPPWSSRPSAASRISSSVRARRGPRRRGMAGADIGADYPLDATGHPVEPPLDHDKILNALWALYKFCTPFREPSMTTSIMGHGLRRATGGLFVVGALAFGGAATVL